MKIDRSQSSEFGEFKLIPEDGKKLRHFIDYTSKLLIVSESPIDISDIPSQHGMRIIPSVQYVVDPIKKKILQPAEWKEYFSYESYEIISPDGKFKETIQRIHEPDKNTDSINYSLFDLEKNEPMYANGSSVAFNERARESSIDRHYQHLESRKKYLRSLELGEYPISKYEENLANLKDGDLLIQYFDKKEVFELIFSEKLFELKRAYRPKSPQEWEKIESITFKKFRELEEFWSYLTAKSNKWNSLLRKAKPWYANYKLRIKSLQIEKYIIESHNKLVQDDIVPYSDYQELQSWMNVNYNKDLEKNIYWQFCSNCRERVLYNPRYPNHACRKCVNLIVDNKGNKLDYRDNHELKCVDGKEKLLLKGSKTEVKIYLNDKEYYASEARFGGVVHQLKE